MKKINLLTLILMSLLPWMSRAQENINRLPACLLEQKGTKVSETTLKNPQTLQMKQGTTVYEFYVKKGVMHDLLAKFALDEPKAYRVFKGAAGQGKRYSLDSHTVGTRYSNFIIECFTDPQDTTCRYAYALEWNDVKGGRHAGRFMQVYGKRPTDAYSGSPRAGFMLPKKIFGQGSGGIRIVPFDKKFGSKKTRQQVDSLLNDVAERLRSMNFPKLSSQLLADLHDLDACLQRNDGSATTMVDSNDGNFVLQCGDNQTVVTDADGNLVFTGKRGQYVVDSDGNMVIKGADGRTVIPGRRERKR